MDGPNLPKRAIYYGLALALSLAALAIFGFGLIEMMLPIILVGSLYYHLERRHVFYFGAGSLLTASIFLSFKEIDFASDLSIIAYFCFITVLIQTIISRKFIKSLSFPNGLMFIRRDFNRILPVLFLIVIVFFAASNLIRANGDIFAGDFNFPLNYENYFQEHFNLWNEHGSWSQPEVSNHTIFLAPFFLGASVFSLSMVAFNKLLLVVLLLMAALGSFCFTKALLRRFDCRSSFVSAVVPFVSAIFYTFSPWIMGRLGHYYLAVGYALLPVIVLLFINALETRKLKYIILTALVFAAAGTVPHNVLYIAFVLLVVFAVWFISGWSRYRAAVFKKYLVPSLGVVALFFMFSMIWILPTAAAWKLTGGESLSPDYMVRIDDIDNAYQDLSFFDFFLSANQGLSQNTPWKLAGSLLILLIPLGVILNIKQRMSWVILIVFIGASLIPIMFLISPNLYFEIFFSKTNGLSLGWLVRDPARTIILVPFCVIIGLALTMNALARLVNKLEESRDRKDGHQSAGYSRYLFWLATIGIALSVAFYVVPLAQDSLANVYLPISIPEDYWQVGKWLGNNSDQNSRTVWYPMQTGSDEFAWSKTQRINNFVDRSFKVRTLGTSSAGGRQFSFLLNSAIQNKNPYLGELLDSFNVSQLIYRQELVNEKDVDISAQKSYLEAVAGMNLELETAGLNIFASQNQSLPIIASRHTYLVLGGSDAMEKLVGLDSVNLAEDSFIFLDQQKYDPAEVTKLINLADGIIFNDAGSLDLATALLDKQYMIYPINFTNRGDYHNYWSGASVNDPLHGEWHEMLATDFKMSSSDFDYNQGVAYVYTEKPAAGGDYYKPALDIPIVIPDDDNYTVLIRFFNNPRSEAFQFSLGDFVTTLDSFGNSAGFSWKSIFTGDLKAGNHSIKLTNISGLNAVSAISVVPTSKLEEVESRAREFEKTKTAYLYSLGYRNLFDKREIGNPAHNPLLYGLSLKNMGNYTNQFYINSNNLEVNNFTKNDGSFSISSQPQPTPCDSVFSINTTAVAPYYNLSNSLYTPEPESVKFEVTDRFSVAVDVAAEGPSKHRRVMTKPIPVQPRRSYFMSFSTQDSDIDILSGVVRQYEEIDSSVPIRSDKLELASPPNSPGEKKFARFFDIAPRAKFIKLEVSTKNAVAGSFRISNLQLFAEDAINGTTGSLIAFTPDLFFSDSNVSPDITVTKHGPEKYTVQVTGASKPFILKFAEGYNPLWQAKIDGEILPHFIANGVFNSYQVEKNGDYVIEIEFATQSRMIIGLLITSISIAGTFLIAFCLPRKKITREHEESC